MKLTVENIANIYSKIVSMRLPHDTVIMLRSSHFRIKGFDCPFSLNGELILDYTLPEFQNKE